MVRTDYQQIENGALEPIRTKWLGFVSNYGTFLTPDPDDVSSKKGASDV